MIAMNTLNAIIDGGEADNVPLSTGFPFPGTEPLRAPRTTRSRAISISTRRVCSIRIISAGAILSCASRDLSVTSPQSRAIISSGEWLKRSR